MTIKLGSIFRVIVLVASIAKAAYATDCYSHDGIEALDSEAYTGGPMVTCGNGTNTCCLKGQYCGSDLLCHTADGRAYRQYCADKNWSQCSDACESFKGAGVQLKVCSNLPNRYCCPGAANDCCNDTSKGAFVVDPANGALLLSVSSAAGSPTLWAQVTPSSTSTTATSPTSSTSFLENLSQSSLVTSSQATTPSSTATSGPSSGNGGLSTGASVGIGIGVAAGAVGLLTLGWLLIRERRKRRVLEKIQDSQQGWNRHPRDYTSPANQDHAFQTPPTYQMAPYHIQKSLAQAPGEHPQEMDANRSQCYEMETPKQPKPRSSLERLQELPSQHAN